MEKERMERLIKTRNLLPMKEGISCCCKYTQTRRGGGGGRVRGDGWRQVNKTFSLSPNFNYKSARYVRPTEYTQGGNGHFLAYVPSWWKTQPSLAMVGVHAHPLSLNLPSRTKLWCKLQLKGQVHYPYFFFDLLCPNGTRLSTRCHFTGPKRLKKSRAQPPPTYPRNGYARIQNIMLGAVKIIGA
jgi:hypothetical protein